MDRARFRRAESLLLAFFSVLFPNILSVLALSDEGKTLLEMKRSLIDDGNALYDWIESVSSDHCSWRGVTCDNVTFNVVALNLSHLNLGGEISPAIGDLKNLQLVDLHGNALSGQIPDEIGDCSSLNVLDVSFNEIDGDIPFSISKLKQLEELILKDNKLTGPVPSTLSQIPNLKILDLAQNRLTGDIPKLIYWSEVLQYVGLRNNFLSGTLSPDMCQMTGLWYFDVHGNNLTGSIPDSIGNCTSLSDLVLSYNELTGNIPVSIGYLQTTTLSLQGNKLTGTIPEVFGLMRGLSILDLSDNQFSGTIPPALGNLFDTGILFLNNNNLTGPIPPDLGNMTNLNYLKLNDNQLTGEIPPELGRLENLFQLDLSGNRLEGSIPQNMSYCTALNEFNAHGNGLNGSIPPEFAKLEKLTSLNLSSNNFSGIIPVELGHIINLDTLDLSKNGFSGHIPASIGDLEHLLRLNLSGNRLNGHLPAEFGNLISIVDADLSSNRLSGAIPQELGQLQNLVSLILNNNSFQGEIPLQLTDCFSLATLNLSYNQLSGDIPAIKNFSRFPPESFLGNSGLCGNWFGASCGVYSKKSKASTLSKAAIVCISLGSTALLFMIILAAYRLNQRRQITKGSTKSVQDPPKLVILHMDMAIYTYDDIMRITENLSDKYAIGYGATSTVYKCVLKDTKPIAIKKLCTRYQHNLHEFETELETIGSIKHRNLVSLHGYSFSPHGNLLFYDYMANGSLWDLLHGPSKKMKPDWDTRLKIAVGAAEGLAYLHHDCNPRIIHRDVKTSNILLDENFEAHVSDFGIAKSISSAKTHTSTYVMGTIGYIDPEYARTTRLNEKSDVYSFGIVLLELLTGRKAVDNDSNLHQVMLSKADNNTVMEAIDPQVFVTCSDLGLVKKTFQLALLCTKKQSSDRPTMQEVCRVLQSLRPVPLPKQPPSPVRTSTQTPDNSHFKRYLDKYAEGKQRKDVTVGGINSNSDDQWLMRFGEVISQNSA